MILPVDYWAGLGDEKRSAGREVCWVKLFSRSWDEPSPDEPGGALSSSALLQMWT